MRSGILNVYKEAGFTSFDVVAKLRGILHVRKIGHAGTLDPAARGVLPVCIGKATKTVGLMTDWTKTYLVDMQLGIRTDSQDMTGTVLEERPVTVSEDMIRQVLASFVGPQDQIPPMYSAKKVGGKKLYEYARKGIEIERKASRIIIYEIAVCSIDLPHVMMQVTCSKGTYIRTLCSDIGHSLGCGAAMADLERMRVGSFDRETALTLDQIQTAVSEGRQGEILRPIDAVFCDLPSVKFPECLTLAAKNGAPVGEEVLEQCTFWEGPGGECRAYDWSSAEQGQGFRAYLADGAFLGIYMRCKEGLRIRTFFYEETV